MTPIFFFSSLFIADARLPTGEQQKNQVKQKLCEEPVHYKLHFSEYDFFKWSLQWENELR